MNFIAKPLNKIVIFFELIKFSHTLFALPFAFIAAILAVRNLEVPYFSAKSLELFAWIALAMVGARSGAMGFNRLVDLKWDSANPRTKLRPSVTGEISTISMIVMILCSFALLVFAAWNLNWLAFALSPVAIFLVCFYSYTKRFTAFSHLFLGLAIGVAPLGSWIAISGTVSVTAFVLGISVLTWIAGFDMLYALQDLDFDRQAGLNSIPVRVGISNSLWLAKIMHLISLICWFVMLKLENLNLIFLAGIAISGILLVWEHSLVKKDDLSKLNTAFFNVNAIVSVTLFVALACDVAVYQ